MRGSCGVGWLLLCALYVACALGISNLPISSPDCLLSGCKFTSTQVLHSMEWRAGECRHNIPNGSKFYWNVQGNVSVYLFKSNSMQDFRRGGKINSLIKDDKVGNYTFDTDFSLDNGGIFFAVFNSGSDDVSVTYEGGFIVQPSPSTMHWPCSNFTTRDSCEAALDGGDSCVWCSNPCVCMTADGADSDCVVGWDARYLSGSINIPDFHFDTWGYIGLPPASCTLQLQRTNSFY